MEAQRIDRLRTGAVTGLVAVMLTTFINVISRYEGWLPPAMDLSHMAELLIDPVRNPSGALALGIVVHIIGGVAVGMSYVYFIKWVYPGFPTLFWGLSVFFVGDLMGKALWKLVENAARFPRRGGRVLCVHGAVSFHRARPCGPRWLPGRGAMRDVELDRRVLGLQSTGEYLCSRQNRRPVQAERSIDPGKTGISGTYAIWETRI